MHKTGEKPVIHAHSTHHWEALCLETQLLDTHVDVRRLGRKLALTEARLEALERRPATSAEVRKMKGRQVGGSS